MTEPKIKVNVCVFAHRETAETRIVYISDFLGGNQAAELWCGRDTGRCFIFHQDAFYDEILRSRRRDGNMISTTSPSERLVFLGNIWGTVPFKERDYFLISKSALVLSIVSIQ